jgi:hypothetical protein
MTMRELERINREMHEALIAAKDALTMAGCRGVPVAVAKAKVCAALAKQEQYEGSLEQ